MRKGILLAGWLVGILLPMAWIGRYSSRYKTVFDRLFSPEWVHWTMHAILFAGFTILLVAVFDLPTSELRIARTTLRRVLLAALGVGLAQEGLQLISGMQILRWNTLLDLGVDAASALVGCLVVIGLRKLRGKVSSHGVS